MRIALVGPFSGPSLTEAFPFLLANGPLPAGYPGAPLMTQLAKALVERGHQVAAISSDFATPFHEIEPFRVYRGHELKVYFCAHRPCSFRSSGGRRGRALDSFRYERDCLRAAIVDYAPDVVHAHWTYEFVWAALDSGFPTLATAHDSPAKVLRFMPSLYRLFRYFMARRVLARCGHLTAVSPDLERDLRHMTRAPITVVANPIPNAVLQSPGCAPCAFDSKTLLMVLNGWTQLKNGARALRAFALARRSAPQLRLLCYGAGFEPDGPARRWAAARHLDVNVTFAGTRPQQEVLQQMRNSMALLHPSRNEACSMTIAEAMSVGLPVIAGRRTGGVAWQLDEGRAGLMADVTDTTDLAQTIVQLSGGQQRWNEISAAARARARQLFAIDGIVDQYSSFYRMCCVQQVPNRAASSREPTRRWKSL